MRHVWIWIGIVSLALSGCGGGGGGDGGGGTPGGSTPPTFDATGRWVGHATGSFTNPAGEEEQDSAAEVVVTQTGNDVSIAVVGDTVVYTGTVSGAVYQVSATLPEPDGSTAETIDFTLTSADAGGGTVTWTYTGTSGNSSGGSNIVLARSLPAQFDMTGSWNVTTSGNFSDPPGNEDLDGTFSVPVSQSGNTVQMTLDGATRTGFLSGADYFVEYEVDEGGGAETTVFITFSLSSATAGMGTLQWRYENGSIIDGGAGLSLSKP